MLPTETLTRIFSYLLPRAELGDTDRFAMWSLCSLCLVNRQFRQTAQPLLYHTISLSRPGSYREAKLLRTLFEVPELAGAVRKVTLYGHGSGLLLPSHRQLLADIIRSVHIPKAFRSQLEGNLEVPDASLFLVFVLLLATRVEELDLAPNIDENASEALLALLSRSIETPEEGSDGSPTTYRNYHLPCLKHISLIIGDEMCSSISGLESVLMRPGLKTLCLQKVYWHLSEDDATHWPEGKSDLASLTLLDSMINGYSVQDIFTRFPNLRVFSFHAASRFSGRQEDYDQEDDPEWGFRADEIGEGLREFGTKLDSLTLRTTAYRSDEAWDGSLWDESLLGSLQEMKSLRKIEIEVSELTGDGYGDGKDCATWAQSLVKLLPPGLEELTVPDAYGTLGQVLELIRGQYFPRLRQITIVPTQDYRSGIRPIPDEDIPGWTCAHRMVDFASPLRMSCFLKTQNNE